MISGRVAEPVPAVAGASMPADTQVERIRAAIERAAALGPRFLGGEVDADRMARSMVAAVQEYVRQERAGGGDGTPDGMEARNLQAVLAELATCGSGYLQGRCDAACVARTMSRVVREFPR